ncbi:MAG: 8-amino-7-oxononanoate synthase [Thiothrix sp.]|nr:MAG: 8-amino-7-oxononanoate synthase [Thiothrix sp.]
MRKLKEELRQRQAKGLYRRRRITETPQQPQMIIDGREVISFCSNDYLGLANHPSVIKAFQDTANLFGVGCGAAHLINGHTRIHHELEEALAEFTGHQRALLFSTGYMANFGLIQALVGLGDVIHADKLNHASLTDGALLSRARLHRYSHGNTDQLRKRLDESSSGEKLIITDAVFSMEGDLAPLPELASLAQEYDAWLMADDAHGLGVLGENGAGTLEHYGLTSTEVPIVMGTLGKALGTAGAFIAGSEDLIEHLIQSARTYIYTTAMPAAFAAATLASLKLVAEEPERRKRLHELVGYFREKARQFSLKLLPSDTPIQGIIIGDNLKALTVSQRIFEQGFMVTAIRPPTVPAGTARLRITLSANHNETQIDALMVLLSTAQDSLGGDTFPVS